MSAIKVQSKSFESVKSNTDELVHLESTQPELVETKTIVQEQRGHHILVLSTKNLDHEEYRIGVVADYWSLLQLGRHIVRVLDPSPQDQALDEMKEIRKLLEDRDLT